MYQSCFIFNAKFALFLQVGKVDYITCNRYANHVFKYLPWDQTNMHAMHVQKQKSDTPVNFKLPIRK